MADTEARWYCVDSIGLATLCHDETEARRVAEERSRAWPEGMPCRAVLMGDVAALVAERDKYSAESARHFVRAREWAERSGVLEAERDRLRAQVEDMRTAVHSCHPGCSNARCVAERLRADVAELLSCLEIIKQRTTHTTYRIGHDVHRMAEGLLAKHQKGASNGK